MRRRGLSFAALLAASTGFAEGPVVPPATAKAKAAKPKPMVPAPANESPTAAAAPTPESPQPEGTTNLDVSLKAAIPDAAKDFERAKALLDKGEESQALISFTDFLRRYPEHSQSVDAHYYLGELLFRQRKYDEAMVELGKVRSVAQHPRVPDAALRIGECWQRLGKKDSARIEWNAVARRFRGTPAAEQARILLKGLP